MNKHSYFCYAAISEDGEGIFEHRHERDADSGELLEWFQEWQFGLEHVPNHSYADGWQDILQNDLNAQKISAKNTKLQLKMLKRKSRLEYEAIPLLYLQNIV